MALGGAIALTAGKTSKRRTLAACNFGALLVHQYEEYVTPGWFPGQFNHGVLKSDQPRNYPVNTNSDLYVNTAFAYPYYVAPILFPNNKWLGLSPVLYGMGQAVGHGILFPRIAGDKYSPGFLASFFLHIPLGLTYIKAVQAEIGPIQWSDWVKAAAYTGAFFTVGFVVPYVVGLNKNSPYAFTKAQIGPHDVTEENVNP